MDNMKKALLYALLTVGALIIVFPFYWMITGGIKTYNEIIANPVVWWPKKIMWENFVEAGKFAPFAIYFKNTVIVSFFNTFITLFTTILAAFAFSRLTFKGRDTLFSILLSTLMVPSQMLIITNYVTISKMRLMDSFPALIIPFTASIFYVFMLRQFFNQIPHQLYLAAKVSSLHSFRSCFACEKPFYCWFKIHS